MKLLGMIVVIAVCAFILTGCSKVEAPPELWPLSSPAPQRPAQQGNNLHITESTTTSGVKCVTAAYYASVALSCDWK